MRKFLGLTGSKLNMAIGLIAGLDFFLFGYDQGVTGSLLTFPPFEKTFPSITTSSNPDVSTIQGISVASYNLGCFVGAALTIFIGQPLGRRKTIFLGSSIMIVGAILQASAFSLAHLIVGRLITGLGNGLNTSTVPTWQSETAKAHKRGKLVMMEGALITGGITVAYWIDFGMYFAPFTSADWRFPLALQILFAIIILIFILGLPESPRWLILKGRDHEAAEILSSLMELPVEDKFIQNELAAITEAVMETSKGSFLDLFTMGPQRNFHRVALAYINQMFQQISGINLITYYATILFKRIGLTGYLPVLLGALNGTEYFLASLIPIYIVERVGRRTLMLVGAAGMAGSMAILAGSDSAVRTGNKQAGIAEIVFLFVFNTFFAWGWLGMTWLYPAEIVPLRIRAPANALSTTANWIFNFMVVMITPVAFASIHENTYTIFAVINGLLIFPFTFFFFPETRCRSLEEMDTIFHKTHSVFSAVSVANKEPRRYGEHGELLIALDEVDDPHAERRRSSIIREKGSISAARETGSSSPS